MESVRLGRDGAEVSAIGMGMWQAGGSAWGKDVRDRDSIAAMRRGVELGMNLVDTAELYGSGHSEEIVGRVVKTVGRESVFIATKVAGYHGRPRDVERACRGSLSRLGVRAIDLYQLHWPDPWDQVPLGATMKALERLQRDGLVRHLGVSNFAVRDLEEARSHLSQTDIVANQVRYNLLQREIEDEVLPYCRREGIGVLAWSPLGKGILTGKYSATRRPKDRVRAEEDMFRPVNMKRAAPLVATLRRIGRVHGKTSAQVALAWLLTRPNVVPIPGVKRAEQVEENAGAAGWSLSASERGALDARSAAIRLDTF
jgi:aryl-alcohol dehydrogenase-like predicted oxidoreductase